MKAMNHVLINNDLYHHSIPKEKGLEDNSLFGTKSVVPVK